MVHLSDDRLLAYLDGELDAGERGRVAGHLAECPRCAEELEALRSASASFSRALTLLDVPAPVAAAESAVRRRIRGPRVSIMRGALLRAAVLVLGFAAMASAALPDSPVRGWLAEAWDQAVSVFGDRRQVPVVMPPVVEDEPDQAGISILPEGGRVHILVKGLAPSARMRVRLIDGSRLSVNALGAAADARFLTSRGRIEVLGGGPGELVIEVPRTVGAAVVEVDGRVYVEKEGDTLHARVPADTDGVEVIIGNLRAGRSADR